LFGAQADVDRANAQWEATKQGWRSGDDLPGRHYFISPSTLNVWLLQRLALARRDRTAPRRVD